MNVNTIICGAMPEATKGFPDNFFDAIVTDIPYGIGFMGKDWDTFKKDYFNEHRVADRKRKPRIDGRKVAAWSNSADAGTYDLMRNAEYQEWCRVWSKEALRIAKPGAFLLCFGGTRTFHRLTCGLEDAGWQIRDCLMWLYGSGFPKSLNISKAIDKAKGAEREVVGHTEPRTDITGGSFHAANPQGSNNRCKLLPISKPATDLARLWDGYGTALKPAWEPIIVAMKPLDGTFAQNAEKHGVAGLNIDGGRIGTESHIVHGKEIGKFQPGGGQTIKDYHEVQGRWPANLLLDEEAAAMLDQQAPLTGAFAKVKSGHSGKSKGIYNDYAQRGDDGLTFHDDGLQGASRFFYCAKASRAERNAGLEGMEAKAMCDIDKIGGAKCTMKTGSGNKRNVLLQNHHPTVKPLRLMEYLCTLLKPPSEHPILLDPFCGSGTTLMAAFNTGWDYIGIDKEVEYVEIAKKRVAWCKEQRAGQMDLFAEVNR